MPIQEIRGLTLSDKSPRVIIINSKDTIPARIFSLLHEYGHVLLRKDGICIPQVVHGENSSHDNPQHIETWCNNFAASILMPKKEFLKEYQKLKEKGNDLKKIIDTLASRFKTSKQATVIRIQTLEKNENISYQYQNVLQEIKHESLKYKSEKKGSGGPSVIDICISQKGRKFISLVLESKKNKDINNNDVIDYLHIDLKHMNKLQEKVF